MRRIFQATAPKIIPVKRKTNPEMLSPPLSNTCPCHSTGFLSVILDPDSNEMSPSAELMIAQTVVIRTARSTALNAEDLSLIVGQIRSLQSRIQGKLTYATLPVKGLLVKAAGIDRLH